MCEPLTITAITTSISIAAAQAAAAAAAAVTAAATAATTAAAAVATTVTTAATGLGIGTTVGGLGGTVVGSALTLTEGVAVASLVGGGISSTVQGVQQQKAAEATVKAADKDAASKRIASLQSFQQTAEASAQQQFEAQRAALQAKGVIKASNLGDRSVRALSRAVGFELGQTEATITRNQEIASLETSARLFGFVQERNARVDQVGSGLTIALNSAAGGISAGANALEIRHRLSN